MERGALWVREWRDGITHIIVDREFSYDQVISFLKIPAIPVSNLEVCFPVNELNRAAWYRYSQ